MCLVTTASASQHLRALACFRREKAQNGLWVGNSSSLALPGHSFQQERRWAAQRDLPLTSQRGPEVLPAFTGNKPLPLPAKSQVSSSDLLG